MKLDNKRTILTGFAFLSICAFWQMYNSIVPLILTNTFHLNETYSGAIMAADNILALFLLPLFGSISDRTNTKIGKRMPFILFGTGLAIILMNILPIIDNSYAAAPSTFKTVSFVVVLGLLLVAMGTYRSPAVALMPDITPKPLRSKGNAIINLMGALGGVIYLGVAAVMYPNSKVAGLAHVNYQPLFIVVASIMFVAVAILFLTIKEPKLIEEQRKLEAEHPEWNLAQDDGSGHETLPKNVKKSLSFLLASIALWFIGYNAVETWFTTYVSQVMGQALGGASTCLLIATGGAVISYIPIGVLASKFNSLPMVVEMCKGSDIGKFTGYYYTFSMAAQVVTPVVAGYLMRNVSYTVLFPYAAAFVALSFVTMIFVKHGDNKPEAKKGLDAFEDMDD